MLKFKCVSLDISLNSIIRYTRIRVDNVQRTTCFELENLWCKSNKTIYFNMKCFEMYS